MPDDIPHQLVRDKPAEFRGEVRDDFPFFPFPHLGERLIPPSADHRILDRPAPFLLEFVVREEPEDVREGATARIIHERQYPVAEIVLDTRSEYLGTEQLDHDIERVLGNHLFLVVAARFEDVDAERSRDIRWIEIDDILGSGLRNEREQIFGQIPVGIDYRDTAIGPDILAGHGLQYARFTGTGLPDHVEMAEPVLVFEVYVFRDPLIGVRPD